MIIDCHGHYTTEPKDLLRWRKEQVENVKEPAKQPSKASLKVSDDEIRESLEGAAQASARARDRRHHLLPARHGHKPPYRRLQREPRLVAGVQRDDPSRLHALPRQFHRRVPIAAVAGRVAG